MSNYTEVMVARMHALAPLNIEKCKELASEFGDVSHRSVISKAKSLEIEYVPAVRKVASRVTGPTKGEVLDAIRKGLALPEREGADLNKRELESVLESIG